MDNLMFLYPLIVLLFFLFFDVLNRKKRSAPPPQQPADWPEEIPQQWQEKHDEDDNSGVPWYVEFPEDRAPQPATIRLDETPKDRPLQSAFGGQNVYLEQQHADAGVGETPAEPLYKRFQTEKKPGFKGFRSRRTVAEEVRHGLVMAVILDKPRSLKPYDDNL